MLLPSIQPENPTVQGQNIKRAKRELFIVGMLLLVSVVGWTPVVEVEPSKENPVRYMFVQSAHSGSLIPVEGEMNYTLTLEGVAPQTIAFLDRPERVVAQVSMQKFLDGLGFSPENPPNAAIEILEGDEEGD
jgi:uncharacterized membrane protein